MRMLARYNDSDVGLAAPYEVLSVFINRSVSKQD